MARRECLYLPTCRTCLVSGQWQRKFYVGDLSLVRPGQFRHVHLAMTADMMLSQLVDYRTLVKRYDAAVQYCLKREAFGKTLMDQPVVRHRLAKAGAELETTHAWVEQILYQLCHMNKEEGDLRLGGVTALAKAKSAMVLNECAQCAVLLFGGNGFTATGQGELVEGEFPAHRVL